VNIPNPMTPGSAEHDAWAAFDEREAAQRRPHQVSQAPVEGWQSAAATRSGSDWKPPSKVDRPDEPDTTAAYLRLAGRLLTRDRLAALPAPEPLIEDTLDRRSVVLLGGRHGTGKSFIAIDWACSVATWKPWQGREVRGGGRSLLVVGEGAYGLERRIGAWEYAWSTKVPPERLVTLPVPVQLGSAEDVAALTRLVRDGDVDLVVVDTLNRCAVGLDENSAKDMGRVVDAAYRIRGDTAACVAIVHHTGKDGATIRGSSAIEAGVDTVYLTEGDAALIKLSRTKRKDGPTFDEHTLRLLSVLDSCVVESTRDSSQQPRATDRAVLKILCDASATGPVSRSELRDMAVASLHIDRATAYRVLKRLVDGGHMRNVGTEARVSYVPTPRGESA
jgi:hypothetical protein